MNAATTACDRLIEGGVHTRFLGFDHLGPSGLAETEHWLAPGERRQYAGLRDTRRRRAWLLGRRTGKELVRAVLGLAADDPRSIELVSRDASGRGVAPQVRLGGRRQPCSLSISHTDRAAVAALSTMPDVRVGVDLVELGRPPTGRNWSVETSGGAVGRAAVFDALRPWLTAEERAWADARGPFAAAALWAAKEAAYKALGAGKGFAPRQFVIRPQRRGRFTCHWRSAEGGPACTIVLRPIHGHLMATAVQLSGGEPFAEINAVVY